MRRDLLHFNQLENFKLWMDRNGIDHRPPKGDYQVLQVRVGTGWQVIYQTERATEHFTVPKTLVSMVNRFVHDDTPRTVGDASKLVAPPSVERRQEVSKPQPVASTNFKFKDTGPEDTTPPWK